MGGMVAIFAPGLTIAKQGSLFFTVARVIFPYVLLISASSLYVGILNSAKKFGPGAFCPVILNLCLIFALFFDLQNPQSTLYLMSFAVIAAGSIQVVYLALVLYKKDLLPKKTSFIFDNNLKNFLKKFLPAAKNRYGWTPLHHVATKGHTEIVKHNDRHMVNNWTFENLRLINRIVIRCMVKSVFVTQFIFYNLL